ncbi:MAG: hypothetical protein KDJ27_14175 [Gammaproteobacteria bacterium]|nr:hypothetical protein [Gammaproteobacteria bacterium]
MTDFESIQLSVTPCVVWRSPASGLRAIPALILVALLLFLSTAPTTVVAGIARTPASHAFAVAPHAREPMPRPPEAARGKGKGKEKSIEQRVREKFPTWRGEELNKVLREVERRDPARGNKLLKEGLSAHEGGAHDGHTIRRHVAVSAKHLEARIEYEKRRAADRKGETRKDHEALKMEHISSFTSLKEANRLVDRALTDANNSATLKKWARDRAFVDPKTGSKQLLELTLRDAGSVTGLAMDPKSKELVEARGVRVLLRRSNGKHGWSIVTAHPVVKAEASGSAPVVAKPRAKSSAEHTAKRKAEPAKPTVEYVTVYHGSISDASAIRSRGLDPARGPTWVSTSRQAAEAAIGSERAVGLREGKDRGVIESRIPRAEFERLQREEQISEDRVWSGFGKEKEMPENVLRGRDAIDAFNRGIVR